MHKGSCLCGSVAYEIDGDLGQIILCHCSRCRKVNGSAFAAVSPIPSENFRLIKGEEVLRSYSVEGVHRFFCGHCASPIISRRDAMPEIVRLRIGSLDTPVDVPIAAHIFTGSKAEWYEIRDDHPQYETGIPA